MASSDADLADGGLGMLARLPLEIRQYIYCNLLVSRHPRQRVGKGSGISIAILLLSSKITAEAEPWLYHPPGSTGLVIENVSHNFAAGQPMLKPQRFVSSPFSQVPRRAVLRLSRVTLRISFETWNRGECELSLQHMESKYYLEPFAESLALAFHHSENLRLLNIELLNENQRKRGRRLVRSPTLMKQMRGILRLFAYLDSSIQITVGGFDTIEYAEMFHEMRTECQGKALPLEEMMAESLTGIVAPTQAE